MENLLNKFNKSWISACLAAGLFMAMTNGNAADKPEWSERNPVTAQLSGDKEVPPVTTDAFGKSTIRIGSDRSVIGTVTVENMKPTEAHIHQGALNVHGPVIIPLNKTEENKFIVPPNTKLTAEQYQTFKEGNLYVNVHSEKFPTGEIRAQMKP